MILAHLMLAHLFGWLFGEENPKTSPLPTLHGLCLSVTFRTVPDFLTGHFTVYPTSLHQAHFPPVPVLSTPHSCSVSLAVVTMKTSASITLNHSTLSSPQTSVCRQVPSHQVLVQCLKWTQDAAFLMSSQGPLMVHGSHFKEQALSVYSLASSLQQLLRLVQLSLLFRWGSQGTGW